MSAAVRTTIMSKKFLKEWQEKTCDKWWQVKVQIEKIKTRVRNKSHMELLKEREN